MVDQAKLYTQLDAWNDVWNDVDHVQERDAEPEPPLYSKLAWSSSDKAV
jgi:hypothetical protein